MFVLVRTRRGRQRRVPHSLIGGCLQASLPTCLQTGLPICSRHGGGGGGDGVFLNPSSGPAPAQRRQTSDLLNVGSMTSHVQLCLSVRRLKRQNR